MNNKVIITESRTVAKAIAQALGVNVLNKGYFGKGNIAVTWTGGNIISATPKSKFQFSVCSDMTADETFAENFNFSIRKDSKGKGPKGNRRPSDKDMAQVSIIEKLWKSADVVYNAMKPSANGEVIFASLAIYINVPRETARVWLRSVTRQSILEAIDNPEDKVPGFGEFHDNAIAEYTIGARPMEGVNDLGDAPVERTVWSMKNLKHEGNNRRGWSPAKTTGVAYSLYNKGLISYPDDEPKTALPEYLKESIAYCAANLSHHPTLGMKARAADITGEETIWTADSSHHSHHGIIPTGLYPVDLTPDEEYLYNLIAGHCLDIFATENPDSK